MRLSKCRRQKDRVQAKVLVLRGAEDPFIPVEQVQHYEFAVYPKFETWAYRPQASEFGKMFNFPALRYDRHADEDSWNRVREFFRKSSSKTTDKRVPGYNQALMMPSIH